MTDWKVGDLAVCVEGGRGLHRDAFKLSGKGYAEEWDGAVVKGAIYTVRAVNALATPVGLGFEEVPGPWRSTRFRKVVRDKHEACEPEFVTLLKRSKQTVPA